MKVIFELPFDVEVREKWETANTRAFTVWVNGVENPEPRFYSTASVQRHVREMIHRDVDGMGFGLASSIARVLMQPHIPVEDRDLSDYEGMVVPTHTEPGTCIHSDSYVCGACEDAEPVFV